MSAQDHPYLEFWKDKFRGLSFRVEGDRLVETDESIEAAETLAAQSVPGQQFVVLGVHRANPRDVRVGDRVTIVPWDYLPSCAYRPFDETAWVTPGDTVVFQLQRTRASDALVFDVTASHDPYPRHIWDFRPRGDDGSLTSPWLSATQHWEFLRLFPRPSTELSPTDQRALEETVSSWARENGVLDSRPVRDWLERRERTRGN